ncbi:hypothetical protein [Allohahella marinimesophila]|uniref:Uncharacterized protein n=1 Tax=Allohahella marinimesophila TaxID=1054972 RepID=A0ABP7NLE1_9GAMM
MKALTLALVMLGSQYSLADDLLFDATVETPVDRTDMALPVLNGQALGPERSLKSGADAAALIPPCYQNRWPVAGPSFPALSFPELFEPSLSNYWPGLNGSVWMGRSDDQLYAIRDLRVLRGSLATVGQPSLTIYDASGTALLRENLLNLIAVNTSKGLLLTGFFHQHAGLHCLDILMPNKSESAARASRLYFRKAGTLYTKTLDLRRFISDNTKEWQQ